MWFLDNAMPGTLLGRLAIVREIARGVDQSKMRKGLWEISDLQTRAWFVLFAEQSDVIAQGEQIMEQAQCVLTATQHEIGIGEPEAARKKDTFACRKAVSRGPAVVTQYQPLHHQPAFDRRDGRNNPGILGRKE